MDFHILGSLEVVDGGRVVAVGGSKQQALLAVLLLHPNETLSTDRLIEELWGDRPPATAAKTLQVHVSRLRKALAHGNGADGVLHTRDRGYQFKLDPERLDAYRFERLIADGRAELTGGRADRAAELLERALALWRGPPLGDFAYEPFAQSEAARLGELRIGAIEELTDAKLALGRHAEVVGSIDALIAEHPYRERLRAQKMLALYRSDRQADALQVFQDTRIRLVQDLGIEPGERLRRLERAVLDQDPALALTPPAAPELPPELQTDAPLVGREEELRRLREQWRRARSGATRLVAIAGEHGIGKTRLAAELAAAVRDDGGDIAYEAGDGAAERARARLADGRPRLLVLDDADGLGGLPADVPVLVLATARQPLPGADVTLTLGPLDIAAVAAVAAAYGADLPAERLAAASGGFPQRVHQLARAWAQDAATRRLSASAARAEEERTSLRATEADLAADVVELRALRRARRTRRGARDSGRVPVQGPRPVRRRGRRRSSSGASGSSAEMRRAPGRRAAARASSVRPGAASRRRCAPGCCRELAGGVLPGSEPVARRRLLRPGEHPLASARARRGGGGHDRLVAVDQFEEIFTLCRDEGERHGVRATRWSVRRTTAPRAWSSSRCAPTSTGAAASYPELAPHARRQPRARRADAPRRAAARRSSARRAPRRPARGARARRRGCSPMSRAEPGALPLMSTSLLELWQRRDGRRLRMTAYEQVGGVDGGVARLAESAYARLDPTQRDIARRSSAARGRGRRRGGRPSGCALHELRGEGRRRGPRRARGRPAGDDQRRRGRGRARGAAARVAAAARLARGGRREPAAVSPAARGRPRLERRRSRRGGALPRRPAGRRAGLGGGP